MTLHILIPVWNDWRSARKLLTDLNSALNSCNQRARVWIVDDSSSDKADTDFGAFPRDAIDSCHVIELISNGGHQRALSAGLGYLLANEKFDQLLMLDGDGEDKPSDLPAFLAKAKENPQAVVVARRKKRSEPLYFRVSYFVYKMIFALSTGRQIDFGNFMLLPRPQAERLAYSQYTRSHIAATIVRLGLPRVSLPVVRGRRYDGKSKLGFVGLVLHGMSAISVFSEIVLTRFLLFLGSITVLSLLGMVAVLVVKYCTDLAIPGWATYVSLILLALMFQSIVAGAFLVFLNLAIRQAHAWVPAIDGKSLVKAVHPL